MFFGFRFNARLVMIPLVAVLLGFGFAACGGDSGIGSDAGGEVETAHGGPVKGNWTLSIWPLYIDGNTVKDFDREHGTTTNYVEDVNDSDGFFGKMQPLLAEGKSGGRSAMVFPDWLALKMRNLGYLQNIDRSAIPNVEKNLAPIFDNPDYDPDNEYTVPWQGVLTGLIVDKKKAPDVKSINDLFDPKYKGRVSLLSEVRETVPLVMAASGIDPKTADRQDWLDAMDRIQEAIDSGQIRAFYGNDYAAEFAAGNVIAGMGWSGDASQLEEDNANLEWRMPTEGCVISTDTFVIPVGSPNPAAALGFIDFVYRPKIAAQITDYVRYMSPVKGVKEVLENEGSSAAEDPYVFPTEESLEKCFSDALLKPEDEVEVTRRFEQLIHG